MNYRDYLPTFNVVEINNVSALRSGQLIAQAPMEKADYRNGDQNFVQNGDILYLDVDNKLKSPSNVDAAIRESQNPILHYTEELHDGLTNELKYFAVEFDDEDIAYPRGIVLNVGDTFTTNNITTEISSTPETLATINDDGQFVLYADMTAVNAGGAYSGPLFHVEPSTLPDGETEAVELTVLATVITVSA